VQLKKQTANDLDHRRPFENLNVLLRLHSILVPTMIPTRAATACGVTTRGHGSAGQHGGSI